MRLDDTPRLRRLILRIMLGVLGGSACLAVLGVLVDTNWDLSFRMIGTGVAATIASALLLASCKFLDSDKYRRTGLFVMVFILAQFLLVLIALWNPLRTSPLFNNSEEALAESAAIFPLAWIPAALFFHVRQLRGGRLAGLLGMASCALALIFFVLGAWSSTPTIWHSAMDWMYWETGWACWFFAFAGAACSAGAGIDRRHWRWIGLAAAVCAFALGVHDAWANRETNNALFAISTTLAILIGHANLIWLCDLKPAQRPLRWLTAIAAWGAGTIFDYATLANVRDDFTWRLDMAAGICAGCGTVAIAILAAFNRRIAPRPAGGIDAEKIDLICPVCRKKQAVPIDEGAGESACAGCGLILSIRVRAPRCPSCDYILLMLHTDRCPECGTVISAPVPSVQPQV